MTPLDTRDLLMWIAIICLVILVAMTGMYLNRFFIHRAHRRALDELHRKAAQNIDLSISSERKPESEVTCKL